MAMEDEFSSILFQDLMMNPEIISNIDDNIYSPIFSLHDDIQVVQDQIFHLDTQSQTVLQPPLSPLFSHSPLLHHNLDLYGFNPMPQPLDMGVDFMDSDEFLQTFSINNVDEQTMNGASNDVDALSNNKDAQVMNEMVVSNDHQVGNLGRSIVTDDNNDTTSERHSGTGNNNQGDNDDDDEVERDEEEEEENNNDPVNPSSSTTCTARSKVKSNNLVSERNRRKRLGQQMLALRSLVPNVTKMDKRSMLLDAIAYINSIREETTKLEKELKGQQYQQPRMSITRDSTTTFRASTFDLNTTTTFDSVGHSTLPPTDTSKPKAIITEMDIEEIDKQRYIVKIKYEGCGNGGGGRGGGDDRGGAGGELIRVMESLNFDMTNTSIDYINPHQVSATIFMRVQKGKMSKEKLKECITSAALRHGISTVGNSGQKQVHQILV